MTQEKRKYAVVDLEATSARSNAKIIQVGIVIIENGQIVKAYETDVNPHEKLDPHIRQLTGLTDKRLRKAPDFSQVAREIYKLIEDAIFVAHNVKFDANLLAEALFWEGFELVTPRIDTVELAQVFFPKFEKYNLGILCEQLEIPLEHAHTALADASATATLFLKIQEKIQKLPKELVEYLLTFSNSLIYESRLAIEDAFDHMSDFTCHDLIKQQGIFLRKSKRFKKARKLSKNFQHNISLLDLEERKEQDEFAHAVEQALKSHQSSFLQAQTGLGKTYGYLLPALGQTSKQILVTVPTKVLQDQIVANEGQNLEQIFHISLHSLKSPANYLKLDFFYDSLQQVDDNRLVNRCKMLLLVWLTETESGDLDEIGQRHRYQTYLQQVLHDGKLSKKSHFWDTDFWQKGQEKSKRSRVLVTNHAYFLTRLEDDKSIVENRLLIVDEAQKLFLALENLSRKSLNMTKCLQQIQSELARADTILQRRLLEDIQFELAHAAEQFQRYKKNELTKEACSKLRQDLSEINTSSLSDLRAIFATKYDQFWLKEDQFDDYRVMMLEATCLKVLDFRSLLPEKVQVLFVSATLEISKKVHLAHLLGFENAPFYQLAQKMKFQQKIWLDKDFPNVVDLDVETYADLIAKWVHKLANQEIPILVLFTSKSLLLAVSERLRLPHLAQYKNGEAANIKRRFDRGETSILLGAGSFWEGTDFSSQKQMIEMITRIPFDNPSDFFTQKLNNKLRQEGKNPFYDYNLPVAILRIKQALGRTVRHQEQQSAVVILDNRILSKRYGRQIQTALEKVAPLSITSMKQIPKEIEQFLKKETM
ncbi:bifunctional DnaQ family exonuclease/ATP-dependent helicase [Streptococcus intermedius]|uniref:bifunctional DnaQ family exonuclease/ATP-dependent helicase n=1 Tax=Streptococcus intermedius TaxID=1338 RepID=UPI00025B7119|nr:bifunctional DnaQ family exonuclease/ATP-dependent helicase [Streptococcus intermedius]EID82398.1 bifunctional ATP-dependent DNA helicase/DNA polymerase III subunit epsilon [Streptococcus intermedius SK54 = ATCC 27335]EPH05152.1 ATP-dependent DNA helicase DinG [Streptococcus intermedius SK54 = ATCC 27335]BAM23193.1 ATP-dependent DNA helicase; DNA polymerase III epsilon subunit homolog [Streptococcus intermedius JTH08]SQH51624.1 putative DnaQ family exonuclease/DinG family helicase [Streptoco